MRYAVRIESGDRRGTIQSIEPGYEYIVGREVKNEGEDARRAINVPSEERHVSREHARIYFKDGRTYLQNLSSHRNATLCNDKLLGLGEEMPLSDGDRVVLGNSFVFTLLQEVEPLSGVSESISEYVGKGAGSPDSVNTGATRVASKDGQGSIDNKLANSEAGAAASNSGPTRGPGVNPSGGTAGGAGNGADESEMADGHDVVGDQESHSNWEPSAFGSVDMSAAPVRRRERNQRLRRNPVRRDTSLLWWSSTLVIVAATVLVAAYSLQGGGLGGCSAGDPCGMYRSANRSNRSDVEMAERCFSSKDETEWKKGVLWMESASVQARGSGDAAGLAKLRRNDEVRKKIMRVAAGNPAEDVRKVLDAISQ